MAVDQSSGAFAPDDPQLTSVRVPLDQAADAFVSPDASGRTPIVVLTSRQNRIGNVHRPSRRGPPLRGRCDHLRRLPRGESKPVAQRQEDLAPKPVSPFGSTDRSRPPQSIQPEFIPVNPARQLEDPCRGQCFG